MSRNFAESGYYPEGVENHPDAPFNEQEIKKSYVDVLISITLSKTVSVKVREDYTQQDLEDAVNSQVYLPAEHDDKCKDWITDELIIIED